MPILKDAKGRQLYKFDATAQEGNRLIGDVIVHVPTEDVPEPESLDKPLILQPVGDTTITVSSKKATPELTLTVTTEGLKKL